MKLESLILAGLSVACIAVCTLVMMAMLTTTTASVEPAPATAQHTAALASTH